MMYLEIFVFTLLTAAVLGQSNKVKPFMCPVCYAEGANADSECEANIVNKRCLETNPVCTLTVSTPSSRDKYRDRECLSREDYNEFKADCKRYEDCAIAMCNKSGCKAEFPVSEGFKCPVCNVRGENATAECDANIELQDCNRANAVCEITKYTSGRVVRQCSDRNTYKISVYYCWKHKNCEKAMCNESECMAEFTGVEAFMCPVCSADGANADRECEANIVNKPCLKTNPVCSLTVSGPSSLYKFRERECLSREDYDHFKDECKRYEDCAMAMCDTSGCKAEIPASA